MACNPTQPKGHWEIQGGCFQNPDDGLVYPVHGVDVYGQYPPQPQVRSYMPFLYFNEGCYVANHRTPWNDQGLSAMFATSDPFQNGAPPASVTKYADMGNGYPMEAEPVHARCQ